MNIETEYKCEAEYKNSNSPNKTYFCGKIAKYICMFCTKKFCIDDMYLLCDKCNNEIFCFSCGFPIKYDKHYCQLCKLN